MSAAITIAMPRMVPNQLLAEAHAKYPESLARAGAEMRWIELDDPEKAVQDALAAKWKKIGLTVEQVSVQDVRYGEAITKKYTEAQAAEIDKQKALNEQQVAKTEAETKKIKAQGEADANAVLNESLTDNVLKQHYIDALSNADQLVVVPDGADTLVQTK